MFREEPLVNRQIWQNMLLHERTKAADTKTQTFILRDYVTSHLCGMQNKGTPHLDCQNLRIIARVGADPDG